MAYFLIIVFILGFCIFGWKFLGRFVIAIVLLGLAFLALLHFI